MKKLTQKDLLVLYLAESGAWQPTFSLKGFESKRGWVGSESDRRLYEVMEMIQKFGYYEVEGVRYVVEERRNGKYKEYRVSNSATKPKQLIAFKVESDGTRVAVETFI